jgi:hypothetical protein
LTLPILLRDNALDHRALVRWDEVREDKNFAQFFKLDEARIMASNRQT